MNNIFKLLYFYFRKPFFILIVGKGRACAKEAISKTLEPYFKGKVLISESDFAKEKVLKRFEFFLKNSRLPILVGTHIGDIPADRDFFDGERKEALPLRKLAEVLPSYGYLVLNFDDETVREVKNKSQARCLTYGFQEGADVRAIDVNLGIKGTNFKVDYQGKIVPFWLENIFGKEQIYSALATIAAGMIKGINLVEISQALKSYQSLPGRMKFIEGIKDTFILDDSENATVLSMIEALEISGKLGSLGEGESGRRRIAVLGDVVGVGKYTIEAHETIGEKVAKTSDLLFAFGSRAKFIAQGARRKGMKEENIFEFDTIEQGKLELQKQIRQGDLILIDGSSEMKMSELVKEIKS